MKSGKKEARKARHEASRERTKDATHGADGSISKKSKRSDDGSGKTIKKPKTLTAPSPTDKGMEVTKMDTTKSTDSRETCRLGCRWSG